MSHGFQANDRNYEQRQREREQQLMREQQERAAQIYLTNLAQLQEQNLTSFVASELEQITPAYEQMMQLMQSQNYTQANEQLATIQRIQFLPRIARQIQQHLEEEARLERKRQAAQEFHASNLQKLQEQMLREAQRREQAQQIQILVQSTPQLATTARAKVTSLAQLSLAEMTKIHQELQQQAIQEQAKEDVRRQTVASIFKSLQAVGFIVQNPTLVQEGDSNYVLIQAARMQGSQARFKVYANGDADIKFDNYRGKACQQDIDKVIPTLDQVYGIKLEQVRSYWENPDDEYASARPLNPTHTSSAK